MTSRHKWICAQLGFLPPQMIHCSLVALAALTLLSGCATGFGPSTGADNSGSDANGRPRGNAQTNRVLQLERMVRNQRSKLDEMRERNLVLEQRLKRQPANQTVSRRQAEDRLSNQGSNLGTNLGSFRTEDSMAVPIPFTPSAADGFDVDLAGIKSKVQTAAIQPVPQESLTESTDLRRAKAIQAERKNLQPEVSAHRPGVGAVADDLSFALKSNSVKAPAMEAPVVEASAAEPTGEHYLYSKIIESYRHKKPTELHKSLQLLVKSYPDSVFADNALYLAGLLAYEQNSFGQAMSLMDRVIREYPQGNKVVTALFAKAMIAKKLQNFPQTEKLFTQVSRNYPGSPEAQRVDYEIKLLKALQTGRIRDL